MRHKQVRHLAAMAWLAAGSCATAVAADIHVATTGSDENPGTEGAPLATIHRAMELVQAGDRILVHEGTYYITERIKIPELPTNPDMRCELRAWPDEAAGKVIIDGSNMNPATANEFKMARCIYVNPLANYWTFYGLVLQNAKDNGMKLEGSAVSSSSISRSRPIITRPTFALSFSASAATDAYSIMSQPF